MAKLITAFLLVFFIPYQLISQVLPGEGSDLNYRVIGFSTPSARHQRTYKLEIASGNYNTEDSFKKNIVVTRVSDKSKMIAEVPFFGTQYSWRMVDGAAKAHKTRQYSIYHFSTGSLPGVDTGLTRLRILQPAKKYSDAYIFIDGIGVLYDMRGQPVWYLPEIDSSVYTARDIRDLKMTSRGTITLLLNNLKKGPDNVQAYEVSYDGTVLWKGPNDGAISKDSNEHYHHQLTRLSDGHYMVLGEEYQLWKSPVQDTGVVNTDFTKLVRDRNNVLFQKMALGTIIEYDAAGKVVWSWRAADYVRSSDLYDRRTPNGLFNIGSLTISKPNISEMHENAFYFDEKSKTIYLSLRNINRIIGISYPGGNILDTYGELYRPGLPETGNNLFCAQHSCNISGQGYLYLYDNGCSVASQNKIVMMKEAPAQKIHLEKIWEYQCETNERANEIVPAFKGRNSATIKRSQKFVFTTGGNVQELPGGSIFVSMSVPDNKVFIVSLDKNILWSALPEKYSAPDKKWITVSAYRASMINDRGDMEQLIWSGKN